MTGAFGVAGAAPFQIRASEDDRAYIDIPRRANGGEARAPRTQNEDELK